MAGVLRELVAVFGVDYDPSGAKRAQRDVDGLKRRWTDAAGRVREADGRLASVTRAAGKAGAAGAAAGNRVAGSWGRVRDTLTGLGIFFGARELARGFGAIVTAASDADETMNVLEVAFKDQQQAVVNFAQTAGDEIGRSALQMKEFAGTIGAIVTPMLRDLGAESTKVSAQVSTDFAKLAVDLASLYNTTDKEALIALRAGLVGEAEPLRRFGVNIVEQNLAEFAGMKPADLQKMSQQEKTMLRYKFIMDQSAIAHGDAARTGDQLANKMRALEGQIRNVAEAIGRKLIGPARALVRGLHDFVQSAAKVIRTSKILESAMLVAAAAAVVFGTSAAWAGRATLWSWIKAAIPVLLMIAILGAAVLAVDDVLVAFAGGKSVFGEWLDGITGVDNAALLFKTHIESLGSAVYELFNGGGTALDGFVNAWVVGFRDNILPLLRTFLPLIKATLLVMGALNPAAAALVPALDPTLDALEQHLKGYEGGTTKRTAGRGVGAPLADPNATVDPITGERRLNRGLAAQSAEGSVVFNRPRVLADVGSAATPLAYPALAQGPEIPEPRFNFPAAPRAPGGATTNNTSQTSRTDITVNVGTGADRGRARDVGREVERGVRQALREERRKVATGVGN